MSLAARNNRRAYMPMIYSVIACLALLAVLPSALNLPLSNPSETLEYAPVTEEGDAPPAGGNLGSLGLGKSSGALSSQPDSQIGGPAETLGKTPRTKRCVGTPARQTEDPFSPPCVANFNGDNFGATYPGVTRDEIRIVFYFGGGGQNCNYNGDGCQDVPQDTLYDLAIPPKDGEFFRLRYFRAWQLYFNDRFQTYNRFVHFYVYYGNPSSTPETRRSDAVEIISRVRPFATLDYVYGNADIFVDQMARAGAISFGGRDLRKASAYSKNPGLVWSFAPNVERMAESFSKYLCKKVKPHKTSFSGESSKNGTPRKYGILHTSSPSQTQYDLLYKLVRSQAEGCGMTFAAEGTYPICPALAVNADEQQAATTAMALFKQENVTTVIWPGCWESNMSHTAAKIDYYPEWIMTDFRGFERSEVGAIGQDQGEWANAWVVTPQTLQNADGIAVEAPCLDAYLSVDPTLDRDSFGPNVACEVYNDIRQLFIGIQVAGARLGPKSIEKGFRAIPAKASTNRDQVSCFYEPGDFTCNKDAIAQWWDPTAAGANADGPTPFKGFQGCYRVGDNGKRYLPDGWPVGDVLTMKAPGQICNLSDQY